MDCHNIFNQKIYTNVHYLKCYGYNFNVVDANFTLKASVIDIYIDI